jgi:outer membrane protein assembly factor BamB
MITIKTKINKIFSWLTTQKGNVIAYIAMVLIIFGVLGGVMASLLTSSVTSSATPNYSRRALYMTEAGMRYGLSELRNSEFATGVIDTLNTTTYTLNPTETFTLNIFGPWFDSPSDHSAGNLTLKVPEGKIPQNFNIPADIWVVNFEYFGDSLSTLTTVRSPVLGFSRIDDTTLEIQLSGDFIASRDERVCLAVLASSDFPSQTLNNEGEDLYVEHEAINLLPPYYGAINIRKIDYVYERMVDEPGNNRVRLENISASMMPNTLTPFPLTVEHKWNGNYTGDFIVLSPRNHIVIPTGASESISAGGTLDEAVYTYDQYTVKPMTRKPDVDADEFTSNLSEIETDQGFFEVQPLYDRLIIGETGGGSGSVEFGASWYDADKAIGGDQDFCTTLNGCKFGSGIRAFFTLDYTGTGDGLTFALINGTDNNASSVGGDIELSELLGYAGDSRIVPNPAAAADYLDGVGNGLRPPKMAIEVDTRTNLSEPLQYCDTAANLKLDSRNDPEPESAAKDVLQYVYWGSKTLSIVCRNDHPSYDDNRHNAEGDEPSLVWAFDTGVAVQSSPAFDPTDNTIYFGTLESLTYNFYGVKSDGSLKWRFNPGDSNVISTPALDTVGTERRVYFSAADGKLYAMKANPAGIAGEQIWAPSIGGITRSSPAVDNNNHNIYVGSSNDSIYAISSSGIQLWARDLGEDIESSPVVDNTGGAYNGTIYIGRDRDGDANGKIFSFDAAGNFNPNWGGTSGDAFSTSEDVDSKPALSKNGSTIYAVDDSGKVYAIRASDGTAAWASPVDLNRSVNFLDPAVDVSGGAADGTIYVATDDGHLYAINPTGTKKPAPWPIDLGSSTDSSPTVGPDGVIYIGTTGGLIYGINPDGTIKWTFPSSGSIGAVRSSPAVGADGIVYVGSDDFNLYAISPLAEPQNIKNNFVTSIRDGSDVKVGNEIVEVDNEDDWLKGDTLKGPWAIRIEVMRSLELNVNGNYDYTLRTWIRQCDTEPSSPDCTDTDIIGTFFQDTRIQYDAKVPHIAQTVELSPADHTEFERFLFGFTGATEISNHKHQITNRFQFFEFITLNRL